MALAILVILIIVFALNNSSEVQTQRSKQEEYYKVRKATYDKNEEENRETVICRVISYEVSKFSDILIKEANRIIDKYKPEKMYCGHVIGWMQNYCVRSIRHRIADKYKVAEDAIIRYGCGNEYVVGYEDETLMRKHDVFLEAYTATNPPPLELTQAFVRYDDEFTPEYVIKAAINAADEMVLEQVQKEKEEKERIELLNQIYEAEKLELEKKFRAK